jgi:hypothetical protein
MSSPPPKRLNSVASPATLKKSAYIFVTNRMMEFALYGLLLRAKAKGELTACLTVMRHESARRSVGVVRAEGSGGKEQRTRDAAVLRHLTIIFSK